MRLEGRTGVSGQRPDGALPLLKLRLSRLPASRQHTQPDLLHGSGWVPAARGTVEHGKHGFGIPTYQPELGVGDIIAGRFEVLQANLASPSGKCPAGLAWLLKMNLPNLHLRKSPDLNDERPAML